MMNKDNTCLFTLVEKLRVVWELTHKCNYECLHCCADAKKDDKDELDTEAIKKGLDNLATQGFSSIYLSGGEPLIRKDIFEIISHATRLIRPNSINLASNGKIITKEIAQQLRLFGLGQVLISLDGHTPELAQYFRGPKDTYENAVNAIETLSSEQIRVRMGVVIWNGNYQNLEDYVTIGIEKGASDIFFNWLIPVGRAANEQNGVSLPPSFYFQTANEIFNLKEKYKDKIKIGYHRFRELNEKDNKCQAGKHLVHILNDGRVTPCSWIYKNDKTFVSTKKIHEATLTEILAEEQFTRLFDILDRREENASGPGCLAMCKIFSGNYTSHDPLYVEKGVWVKK